MVVNLSKFETKVDEFVFLGYSCATKAFKVYNLKTMSVMKSIHIVFDDKRVDELRINERNDTLVFENKKDTEVDSSEDDDLTIVCETYHKDVHPEGEKYEND